MAEADPKSGPSETRAVFATTHWSVVLAAGAGGTPQAAEALAHLCRTYWYPLYAYLRRQGRTPHDAQDLTQGFFAQLIERDSLGQVQGRSKFRSFLLGALKNFVASEWHHARRLKRGGGTEILSLNETDGEGRYRLEPADDLTPEKLFDRRWAMTLLEQTLAKLGEECRAAGKDDLFAHLKGTLTADGAEASYAEISARLRMSEGAVKVAAHRLRQRYGELLRQEIAQTVTSESEMRDEIHELFAALAA